MPAVTYSVVNEKTKSSLKRTRGQEQDFQPRSSHLYHYRLQSNGAALSSALGHSAGSQGSKLEMPILSAGGDWKSAGDANPICRCVMDIDLGATTFCSLVTNRGKANSDGAPPSNRTHGGLVADTRLPPVSRAWH